MSFFSNFNKKDKDLDERTRLNRRKSMVTIRFIACAYVAYLAYRLFTSTEESPGVPDFVMILAPIVLLAGAVFIAVISYNEKKLVDKKLEELSAKELSENESSEDNKLIDEDHEDDDFEDDEYDREHSEDDEDDRKHSEDDKNSE